MLNGRSLYIVFFCCQCQYPIHIVSVILCKINNFPLQALPTLQDIVLLLVNMVNSLYDTCKLSFVYIVDIICSSLNTQWFHPSYTMIKTINIFLVYLKHYLWVSNWYIYLIPKQYLFPYKEIMCGYA